VEFLAGRVERLQSGALSKLEGQADVTYPSSHILGSLLFLQRENKLQSYYNLGEGVRVGGTLKNRILAPFFEMSVLGSAQNKQLRIYMASMNGCHIKVEMWDRILVGIQDICMTCVCCYDFIYTMKITKIPSFSC
jgi:hypothetical protein